MKIVVTKCYLVQVTDAEGSELDSEYIFCNRSEALKAGREMKEALQEKMSKGEE